MKEDEHNKDSSFEREDVEEQKLLSREISIKTKNSLLSNTENKSQNFEVIGENKFSQTTN